MYHSKCALKTSDFWEVKPGKKNVERKKDCFNDKKDHNAKHLHHTRRKDLKQKKSFFSKFIKRRRKSWRTHLDVAASFYGVSKVF